MSASRPLAQARAIADRYVGVLGESPFRLLYLGRLVSTTGDKIAPVALAFAVLALTGSPADLGFVLSARVIAMVAFLLAGGVWSDRLPRRFVLIATDLLRFLTQGATALLLLAGSAAIWQLVVLQVLAGGGQAFFRPASTGLIPTVVSKPRLQQANALLGVSEQATNVLGPVIAGAFVATAGPGWAIALDALSYLVSALFLVALRIDESLRRIGGRSFIAELGEGWRAFRSRTWLVALVGEYALYHFAVFAPFYVLGPTVAARELGGAPAWGTILALYGLGAIAGGIGGLRLRPRRPLFVVSCLFLVNALPLVALALLDSVVPIAVAASLAGAATGYGAAVWETTLQERVPPEVLSRVSSYDWLGSMAFLPLGYAAVGPAAEWLGVGSVLLIGATLQAVSVPALLAVPSVRAVDGVNAGLKQAGSASP